MHHVLHRGKMHREIESIHSAEELGLVELDFVALFRVNTPTSTAIVNTDVVVNDAVNHNRGFVVFVRPEIAIQCCMC